MLLLPLLLLPLAFLLLPVLLLLLLPLVVCVAIDLSQEGVLNFHLHVRVVQIRRVRNHTLETFAVDVRLG